MEWRSRRRASAHKTKSYRVSPRRLRSLRNPEKPQAGGVFFFLEQPRKSGSTLDLLLTLPSEITRGEPVRVRCEARVQRTETAGEGRVGIAAKIERYRFLPGKRERRRGS